MFFQKGIKFLFRCYIMMMIFLMFNIILHLIQIWFTDGKCSITILPMKIQFGLFPEPFTGIGF